MAKYHAKASDSRPMKQSDYQSGKKTTKAAQIQAQSDVIAKAARVQSDLSSRAESAEALASEAAEKIVAMAGERDELLKALGGLNAKLQAKGILKAIAISKEQDSAPDKIEKVAGEDAKPVSTRDSIKKVLSSGGRPIYR